MFKIKKKDFSHILLATFYGTFRHIAFLGVYLKGKHLLMLF